MKKMKFLSLVTFLAIIATTCLMANPDAAKTAAILSQSGVKIGVVNFKQAVEESKMGKREEANFLALKKQMETVLEEKEKGLNEISNKFNDPDYIDSLSADAENELKHKFRILSQERGQLESQYYQVLSQTNSKVVQNLSDMVDKASSQVAKEGKLDFVFNDEGIFYFAPELDISKKVIALMDKMFDEEEAKAKLKSPTK